MELRDRALTGVLWSALETWGKKVVEFLVFLLLARLLQPEAFGLVALANVYIAFVRVFVNQGFASAIVQRDNLEDEHLHTAFWTNVFFGVLIAGGSVLLAVPVARLLGNPDLPPIIRWLAPLFVLNGLRGVPQAIFKRDMDFRVLSVRSLVAACVGGVVGVGMALNDYGVMSLVGQQVVTSTTGVAVLWQAIDWRPRLVFSRRHFNDLFSFGVNILGRNVLNFFNRRTDDLLIGAFLGTTALGYYTVAYRILRVLTRLLASVVTRVTFPTFSRMQNNPARLRNAYYTTVNHMALIAFPVFIGLCVTAPEAIPVFFGKKWMPSIPIMQVLAFIGLLHTTFYPNNSVILAMGKSSWALGLSILNAVANVIAFALAVPWGIFAVASAYVVRGYAAAPAPLWLISKLIQIDASSYARQLIAPAVASALLVPLTLTLPYVLPAETNTVLLLIAKIAVGAAAYLGTLALIAPATLRRAYQLAWRSVNQVSA